MTCDSQHGPLFHRVPIPPDIAGVRVPYPRANVPPINKQKNILNELNVEEK